MDSNNQLQAAIEPDLATVVREATGRPTFTIDNWSISQLSGGATSAGVHRLSGVGRDEAGEANWSLILKSTGLPDPIMSGLDDWRREIHIYRSGLLTQLPPGLRAPRCYRVDDQADGSAWLWLEDVRDKLDRWSLKEYDRAAQALGRFNGAFLAGWPMPNQPWLSHGWLRTQTERSDSTITQFRQHLDQPWVRRMFPPDMADFIFETWAEREVYLGALERLPQTFCHMDAFRRNLFLPARTNGAVGGDDLVGVDWSYTGVGAVGEELVPLVVASVFFHEVDSGDIANLEGVALTAYIHGLREAGWDGDVRHVRLGYAAAGALRYGVSALWILLPMLMDDGTRIALEHAWNRPMAELIDFWVDQQNHFTVRLAREARALMRELDIA